MRLIRTADHQSIVNAVHQLNIHARCRSCGAAITWAQTSGGRSMPVDTAPAPDGNLILRPAADPRESPLVVMLDRSGTYRAPGESLHSISPPVSERRQSHFSSCPNAASHRRNGNDA